MQRWKELHPTEKKEVLLIMMKLQNSFQTKSGGAYDIMSQNSSTKLTVDFSL